MYLIRLIVVICCMLFGAAVMATPVGAITDTAGERIGMRDIPDRGDYPFKLHRRYCVEAGTYEAVRQSVLIPNSISSDRRMPAYEVLEVRCKSLRAAWKTYPVYASEDSSQLLKEVSAKLSEANTKLVSLESDMKMVKASMADIPPAVERTIISVSPQVYPWWKNPTFWTFVLLSLLLILVVAALAGQPFYQRLVLHRTIYPEPHPAVDRVVERDIGRERDSRPNLFYRSGWIERTEDPHELRVYVALGTPSRELRLFRYQVRRTEHEGYRLLEHRETDDPQIVADQVFELVDKHFGIETSDAVQRRYIEEAMNDGRLKEIRPSRNRPTTVV